MMANREGLRAQLLATFHGEAEELLGEIAVNLRGLDQSLTDGGAAARLEAAFRAMHTLKGAARSVSLSEVETLCGACEVALSRLTRGEATLQPATVQRLRQATDGITRLIADGPRAVRWQELAQRVSQSPAASQAQTPAAAPVGDPAAAPAPPSAAPAGESIRIDSALFDDLIVRSEELLLPRLAAAERAQQARSLAPLLSRCRGLLKAVREQPQAARQPLFDQLADALDQSERLADGLRRGLDRLDRGLRGAVDGVLDGMRRVRMTPAASILDLLPDMVQDLAKSAAKDISCTVEGGQLPIDRLVLQAVKDPLIHLVRNAVDHGIEPSDARRAGGKPVPGVIAIAVQARDGARIGITVADDGGGIDLELVKAAAIRRRVVTAEGVERMSEPEILRLILRSGLSTRPVVTEISGHGLGLAVVAARVERLDGSITIENRPGRGASFVIDLPASVVSFHGLLVEVHRQSFLLPLDAVETVVRIGSKAGAAAGVSGRVMEIAGRPTVCGSLAQILDLGADENASDGVFVVVAAGGERAAFRVDEVLGDREVLLRAMQPPLARVRNIAGAGLLGTGELALVLRPADLLRSLRRARSGQTRRPATPARRRRPTILVVDDSLTTRMMEKNLLEAMGYGVRVAADGTEAWHLLADDEIDLVVSDVDMPRMNGFELTERIRADRRLADLPVILVSALEARDDKAQGIRAGANAYVVKSSFENTNLQEMIERFL